jgi:hypothetical protein
MSNMPTNLHDGEEAEKLQQAFFDYASKHRRETMISRLGNETTPTMERYDNLKKIFGIKFFRDAAEKTGTVDDQIAREKIAAEKAKREISTDYRKIRRKENERVRSSCMYFANENDREEPASLDYMMEKSHINNYEEIKLQAKSKINRRMSQFSFQSHNPHIVPLKVARPHENRTLQTMIEARKVRYGSKIDLKTTLLPPPVPVKQQQLERRKLLEYSSASTRLK